MGLIITTGITTNIRIILMEQLHGVGAKILGVVLNDVQPKSGKYGYYYHRYCSKSSYYYSADGTKKKKSHKEPSKEKELKQG